MTARETLARRLSMARDRTLRLVEFDDAELRRQYDPLMSPLLWDLAHIGWQEELWLLRGNNPHQPGMLAPEVERLYDAFENSRASRVDLPLLPPTDARNYCATVRNKALDTLDALPDDDSQAAFNFGLVISHENQHDETMLQALNLRSGPPLLELGTPLPNGRPGVAGTSVLVPGGPFVLGVDAVSEPHSLDNERPAHTVDVPSFRIGRVPVTNGEWRQFIDDGGYRQSHWWSERGWSHREKAGLTAPQFWNGADLSGTRTRFGHVEDVPADEPVQHVTYFEAEAYAAWAGARLPNEIEWEKACAWDPEVGARRRFPWGTSEPTSALANLGGEALRPAPVGAYPAGASAYGVEQMLGRRVGVDHVAAAALARLRADALRAVQPAVLRRRLQSAARRLMGGRRRHPAAELPQLGPPHSAADLQRTPAGLGRLMCRHLGWLGEPRSVASLVMDPPSGLLVQSYAPRLQKHGLMNADGWGVGFFDDGVARRWRSAAPLWGDTSFASVAPALHSGCVVAAVRSASAGMPIESSASAPFTDGHWLLSHNGLVDRAVLPTSSTAESTNDSALLAALIFERGLEALGDTIAEVAAADPNARLNILAGNGSQLRATTWGDTLFVLRRDAGVILASEPFDDDPDWQELPDRQLVTVDESGVELIGLKGPA